MAPERIMPAATGVKQLSRSTHCSACEPQLPAGKDARKGAGSATHCHCQPAAVNRTGLVPGTRTLSSQLPAASKVMGLRKDSTTLSLDQYNYLTLRSM